MRDIVFDGSEPRVRNELVSRVYALDDIHTLLADMRSGGLARGVPEVGAA